MQLQSHLMRDTLNRNTHNRETHDRNRIISSAELVHSVHVNYKKVTKHTLAENQHLYEMTLIVYQPYEFKLQADRRAQHAKLKRFIQITCLQYKTG